MGGEGSWRLGAESHEGLARVALRQAAEEAPPGNHTLFTSSASRLHTTQRRAVHSFARASLSTPPRASPHPPLQCPPCPRDLGVRKKLCVCACVCVLTSVCTRDVNGPLAVIGGVTLPF